MIMVSMLAAPAFSADELFDTATASKHIERGISFLKAKDFDAAIKEFDESVTIAPEAEAYYYLGYAYYMKSRKTDGESRRMSRDSFEKAYEIDQLATPCTRGSTRKRWAQAKGTKITKSIKCDCLCNNSQSR